MSRGPEFEGPWVVLGSVAGAYGVRGWVRIRPFADDPASWVLIRPWFLQVEGAGDGWTACDPLQVRLHGGEVIALLAGVEDREAAEGLKARLLAVPRSKMPEPEAGSFYWGDLVGLRVVGRAGSNLGVVDRLIETGANDVLVVRDADGQERLLPFVGNVIEDVDLAAGLIRADWDAGW